MRNMIICSTLALAGCVTPDSQPTPARPDNSLVLAAVLDAYATGLENDGRLEKPRFKNTSHVTAALSMALEYRVGGEDIFEPGWLAEWDRDFAERFEAGGEPVVFKGGDRADVVEFIRAKSEELTQ